MAVMHVFSVTRVKTSVAGLPFFQLHLARLEALLRDPDLDAGGARRRLGGERGGDGGEREGDEQLLHVGLQE